MNTNPYESSSVQVTDGEPEILPDTRLATWAVVLALLLGFSPLGGDILFVMVAAKSALAYGLIAFFFIAVILTPVFVLYRESGTAGLTAAPVRIGITLLIVVVHACVDVNVVLQLIR